MARRKGDAQDDRREQLHNECRTRSRIPITSSTSLEERRNTCNHRYEPAYQLTSRYCVCCGKREP